MSNPSLVFAQIQTIEHLPESDNWSFSCSAMLTLALDQKCFFRIKKSDNSIVYKRVETSVPGFSGISPQFSTNQNFWGCTCSLSSTPLIGQRDINLEKSLHRAKYPIFPAECSSHFSCITSPLDNLRCKQQLEKVLPVQIYFI